MGMRVAYPGSLYFSEQLSCIKFFHRSYGLKVINFLSFNQLKAFSGFYLIVLLTLSRIGTLTGSNLHVGPHCHRL